MKKYFIVSLCKNGILGGGISATDDSITYKTGKLTIPDELKRIEMKYKEIRSFKSSNNFLFPTVSIEMHSGKEYKFLVFAKKNFIKLLKDKGVNEAAS